MTKKVVLLIGLLLALASLQAQIWNQIGNAIEGEAAGDNFGWSLSLSADGSVLAIGGPRSDVNGRNSGHVRIFENRDGTWSQVGGAIKGESEFSFAGRSVSLNADGSVVAIGAPNADQVRIFENEDGSWNQIGNAIEGEVNEELGKTVNLSADGSVVAIGDYWIDGDGSDGGDVRIFENQGGTWSEIGHSIEGKAPYNKAGRSVGLSADGSVLALGDPWIDHKGCNAGDVCIFENQDGTLNLIGNTIKGEAAGHRFCRSVCLNADGSVVAIGSFRKRNNNKGGDVRIFENQSGTWDQIGNVIEGAADDKFGWSVSLSADGSVVAIGAPRNDGNGSDAGCVRVYKFQP